MEDIKVGCATAEGNILELEGGLGDLVPVILPGARVISMQSGSCLIFILSLRWRGQMR